MPVSPSDASSAAPVGIAVGSSWLLGERLGAAQRIAMALALALAGVLVVVAKRDPGVRLGVRFMPGDGWIHPRRAVARAVDADAGRGRPDRARRATAGAGGVPGRCVHAARTRRGAHRDGHGLAPVYAAALAWLLLGERPQPYHLIGALLILPSIHFATRLPPTHHGGARRARE